MAVVAAHQTWNGRRAVQADSHTEYEQVWRVETDDPTDEMKTIMDQCGILYPSLFDYYQDANGNIDREAFCNRIEPLVDQDDPYTWIVRFYYTTDLTANPWLAPPEISWTTEKYERYDVYYSLDETIAGNPLAIVNSAGEMFDPPPAFDDFRLGLTIKVNRLFYDATLYAGYIMTVNEGEFYGFDAGEWRVESIDASKKQYGTIQYWEVTFKFQWRKEGWKKQLLNMGFRERVLTDDGSAYILRQIRDVSGALVTSPYPLQTSGAKAIIPPNGDIMDQITKLEFTIYETADYDDLELE